MAFTEVVESEGVRQTTTAQRRPMAGGARLCQGRYFSGGKAGAGVASRRDRHRVLAQPPPRARQLPRVLHALESASGSSSTTDSDGFELTDPRFEIRKFQYDRYPSWVRAEGGPRPPESTLGRPSSCRRWPRTGGAARALAGCRDAHPRRRFGVPPPHVHALLSVPAPGPIRHFVRPEMLRRFGAEAMESEMSTLCNGAFIGLHTGARPRAPFCASGGRARWISSASRRATRRGGTIGRTRPR